VNIDSQQNTFLIDKNNYYLQKHNHHSLLRPLRQHKHHKNTARQYIIITQRTNNTTA